MKKIAIYPGSFNPWHAGHQDVIVKASHLFDKIIVAFGYNPDKDSTEVEARAAKLKHNFRYMIADGYRDVVVFNGLLADYINKINKDEEIISAVIRGLRNEQDFCFEQIQQYHNEDLDLEIPTYYVIADRSLVHISSSAVRMIERARK